MPNVNKPKPATNIIKAATLYLVASDPLLSRKVSAAKELDRGSDFCCVFFLDENISQLFTYYKLIEFLLDREK